MFKAKLTPMQFHNALGNIQEGLIIRKISLFDLMPLVELYQEVDRFGTRKYLDQDFGALALVMNMADKVSDGDKSITDMSLVDPHIQRFGYLLYGEGNIRKMPEYFLEIQHKVANRDLGWNGLLLPNNIMLVRKDDAKMLV